MASVNKVILIGNLTRDPEIRYTPKGTAVCEIGLALNRKYKSDAGVQEEVTYVDVTFWSLVAESVNKYMEKGRSVYVEGRLKLDQWQDKETGKNRQKLSVVGELCQFLGSNPNAGREDRPANMDRPASGTARGPLADQGGQTRMPLPDDEEDDIPF